MANDLRIKIKFDKDTGELVVVQKEFKKLAKNINNSSKNAVKFHKRIAQMAHLGIVVYGIKKGFDAIFNSVKDFTQTAMMFEKFETVLTTIEGSSLKAKESMSWIRDFTTNTPYQLEQVTDSFVRLKAYGIDPTKGTLRILGDTASAMGKDLNQAVEAMADAVVGENERLKEFGIKASIQGDKIAYNWTNASGKARHKIIQNNSKIIQSTLEAIFNSKYQGAMKAQSQTFAGLLSNIKDKWTELKNAIMENGLFAYLKAMAKVVKEEFTKSFKTMENAGGTVAISLIKSFESIAKAIGHIVDVIDIVKIAFSPLLDIFDLVKAFLLDMFQGLKAAINLGIKFSNYIANTFWGKSRDMIKFKFDIQDNFYGEALDEIENRTKETIKLFNRDVSSNTELLINNINKEFSKVKKLPKVKTVKNDYGEKGSSKGKVEDKKKLQDKFTDDFIKATSTRTNYAIYSLNKRYAEHLKNIGQTKQLEEWYSKEYQKILDNRESTEKTWQEGAKDALKEYAKNSNDYYTQAKDTFAHAMTQMEDSLLQFVKTGKLNFSSLVDSILQDILRMQIRKNITGPIATALGSLFGGAIIPSAHGNAFVNGQIQAFASGGVVNSPTIFNHSSGLGLMGEAGSEAIMPLKRINGDLGVKSSPSKVTLNITNNTGNEIKAEQISSMMRTNDKGEQEKVINIVIDGFHRNINGMRDMFKGGM